MSAPRPSPSLRRPAGAAAATVLLVPVALLAAPAPASAADHPSGITAPAEEPVATGVDLLSGPVAPTGPEGTDQFASLLTVDLDTRTGVEHVDGGNLTSPATVEDMAADAEAPEGSTVVAAVNGGFFDLGTTEAPTGAGMRDGHALTSPAEGFADAVVIDADGTGRIARTEFGGTASLPSGDLELDALNAPGVPPDGLGLYTADWGAHPRSHVVHDPGEEVPGPVAEAVVSDRTVDRVHDTPGSGPIGAHEQVLLARGAAAEQVAALEEGDQVEVEHALTAEGTEPSTVLGGRTVLVRDGEAVPVVDDSRAPRTAVGFSEDGRSMYVVATDGRNPTTPGSTLGEVAELLAAAGADNALELDGGGSSTLLARQPGGVRPALRNRAGDGPRRVPDGLVVTAPEGSAHTVGLWMTTALEPRPEHGSPTPAQEDPSRVFTGLHRTLTATGHDEAFGPSGPGAPEVPDERTDTLEVSAPTGHGDGPRYVAGRPGPVAVTGRSGPLSDTVDLEVLPAPDTLSARPARLGLAAAEDSASFVLAGTTGTGQSAPVEPVDTDIEVDPHLAEVLTHDDGRFEVRPRTEEGAGILTVRAAGVSTEIPLTVGTDTAPVAAFDDAEEWTAASTRGLADARPEPGREGPGLALTYDFTRDVRTRDASVFPPEPLELDRQAFSFTVRVRGDGNGARPVLALTDADGVGHALQGPDLDTEGWRDVRLEVPDHVAHPVTVSRLYLVEDDPDRGYTGEVLFDGITAATAPEFPAQG